MSGCILHLEILHSPVFLLNSCLDLFSAPRLDGGDPLSRSYRVNLPSSLTVNHSSASVFSTRPRVSVYGTGAAWISLADFLGSMVTSILRCASAPYTLRFDSPRGFAYGNQYLHPSTGYSVSRQDCHFSVSTSLHEAVWEY